MKNIFLILFSFIVIGACSKDDSTVEKGSAFNTKLLVGKEWWATDSTGTPNDDFYRFTFVNDSVLKWSHVIYLDPNTFELTFDTAELKWRLLPADTLLIENTGSFKLTSIKENEWKAQIIPTSSYPGIITWKPVK